MKSIKPTNQPTKRTKLLKKMQTTNNNNNAIRFPLSAQTPGEALTVIGYVTNQFNDLPEAVYYTVVHNISIHHGKVTYGYLPAGQLSTESIKIIVGKEGCYMKMTTAQSGAYFLWHDRQKNIFMFWGTHMSVIKAMHAIRNRIEKYGKVAAAAADTPVVATYDDDEDGYSYYERLQEIELDREPEQPVFQLSTMSTIYLPDSESEEEETELQEKRRINRQNQFEQHMAAKKRTYANVDTSSPCTYDNCHLACDHEYYDQKLERFSSLPLPSSDHVVPCITAERSSSAPLLSAAVTEPCPESPLPVLEPCPFVPVDDFIGFDDEDIPTIESIEKRFQDGLIYLEKNPDLVKFVENRVLPSIEDIAISHLPKFTQLKNELGFKNEAPCDFAMYLATLHTRLLKAKFEVAEREYENYKKMAVDDLDVVNPQFELLKFIETRKKMDATECKNRKPITMVLNYFKAKPHLEKFVREFDEPMGFVWSTDPRIDELYKNLGQETDSPSSFALYLRELQAILKKEHEKKYVHVNRCIECKVDMGDCNPRQYCGKTECVGLGN